MELMQPILLNAATATGAGTAYRASNGSSRRTFQATVAGTGAVTATVAVEVSNDGVNFLTLGIVNLAGTNSASDGFYSDAPWTYYRGNVTAISGTGAAVSLRVGG